MPRDISTDLQKTKDGMLSWGYRPVTKDDIIPNQELVMVEVNMFIDSAIDLFPLHAVGCTVIQLDEEPIKLSNRGDGSEVAYYHCIMPKWDSQCFIPLIHLLYDAYVPNDPYANATRYFIKK